MIRRVGRLSGESGDDNGESADTYILTGVSALELADSELESADSSADSAKVDLWVWAFKARTHKANLPSADSNSRSTGVQNIEHV